ncbi:MAG: 50S ribosomal protein L5 [Candidatus Moraniibacteriota bacterium]|nr:MAG: 50S ribosomal protein L5 [Candidatus Moranbacteria bacterium]
MEKVDVNISLKELYRTNIVPKILESSKKKNVCAVPRVVKVVINAGIGKFLKEESRVEEIVQSITEIAGQKPVFTKAKKAIAGFKIREGLPVGVMVTLRGERMWSFLDRLIKTAFPRVRDFQGIAPSVVDGNGHINVGIREHSVFPEIIPEKVQTPFSLQITLVTTAHSQEEGQKLARMLGFPLQSSH